MKHKVWIWIVILVCIVILLIAAAVFLRTRDGGHIANIYQDGVCIASIDLDAVSEPCSFDVTDDAGHCNTISVEPGRICVSSANCPDQICVETGWLQTGITPIVCLPAKLVIQLEDNAESNEWEVDGVAGWGGSP